MKKQNIPPNNQQPDDSQVVVETTTNDVKLIEQLTSQLEVKNNEYLRALADYHNLERRTYEEGIQGVERAQKTVLLDILSLKDDIDKAHEFKEDEKNSISLKLIQQKCDAILKKHGVNEIDALHKDFNPHEMECIEAVSGDTENKVVKIHEKGYLFQGKLLRPVRVAVSHITSSI